MANTHRSGCPINLSLQVFGKWSLLILQRLLGRPPALPRTADWLAAGHRSHNILANRLKRLVDLGMLRKRSDPSHKQKAIYSLTEASIELVPVMAALELGSAVAAGQR